jgi:uncharacterized damage-inducible protein DinB
MQTLRDLARYNSWANQRVFASATALSGAVLSAEARGTYGSVKLTLAHLVEVEDIYLLMLQGSDPSAVTGNDNYFAHDTVWFAQRSRDLGAVYDALLAAQDEAWLASLFTVPWFGFPMSRRAGLLQTWTHSAQHRSQILSELGSHGIETPDIDYVYMLSLEHEAAGN